MIYRYYSIISYCDQEESLKVKIRKSPLLWKLKMQAKNSTGVQFSISINTYYKEIWFKIYIIIINYGYLHRMKFIDFRFCFFIVSKVSLLSVMNILNSFFKKIKWNLWKTEKKFSKSLCYQEEGVSTVFPIENKSENQI